MGKQVEFLKERVAELERVNLVLETRLKQANHELGFLAIDYEKPATRKSKLGKAELVLAYQMKASGVPTKFAASTFGVTVEHLRKCIRRCEIHGLGWLQ